MIKTRPDEAFTFDSLKDHERFFAKINKNGRLILSTPCWEWTAGKNHGDYGAFHLKGTISAAHRVSFINFKGAVGTNLIDHLCKNHCCVNPDHLESVSQQESLVRRSPPVFKTNRRGSHCSKGHEFTPENTYDRSDGSRSCRSCDMAYKKISRDRKKLIHESP
jgi:hypothetical protein